MKTKTAHDKTLQRYIREVMLELMDDVADLALKELAATVEITEHIRKFVEADKRIIMRECSDNGFNGLPFITVTLPRLGKGIDKMLSTDESMEVDAYIPELVCSVDDQPYGFMSWAIDIITDDECKPNGLYPGIVRSLRQVSYLAYKLRLPFDKAQVRRALDGFVANDHLVCQWQIDLNKERLCPVNQYYTHVQYECVGTSETEVDARDLRRGVARVERDRSVLAPPHRPAIDPLEVLWHMSNICNTIFQGFDPWDIVPRHGPGAVSTGERGVAKLNVGRRAYARLAATYGVEYFSTMPNGIMECIDSKARCPESGTTKVVLVPKDSRGPRVISCEPLEYQWIQQGLGRAIMARLESHRYTKGRINFTYQSVNANLALESSKDGKWVTIDLKDASDLVSLDVVQMMFQHRPDIVRCLTAARSEVALLPDGRRVELSKFAPMGSALCFPVESLVFWLACVTAIHIYAGVPLKGACGCVYVYGDDIVVKSAYHRLVAAALTELGLKLNSTKCCTGRFFRESCGTDAYNGSVVTPARWRTLLPSSSLDVVGLFSIAELSNGLYERGFIRTAEYFARKLVRIEPLTMLVTRRTSGFLQLIRPYHLDEAGLPKSRKRYNKRLMRTEILGLVADPLNFTFNDGCWRQVSHGILTLENASKDASQECLVRPSGPSTSYPFATRVRRKVAWRPLYFRDGRYS